jgi:type IV pilus assembly protein PilY1
MSMKKKTRSRVAAFVRHALLAAAGSAALGAWAASAPAQVPLVSQFSDPPAPNIMLTLDDSGSMQAHYMPEGDVHFTVGGNQVTVTLPKITSMNDLIDVFPNDGIVRNYGGQIPKGVAWGDPSDVTNIFQRQMRSSDVNSIFYNPAVLYLPWVQVPKTSPYTPTRFPDATWGNVYWNPADTTRGSIDLSQPWTPPVGSPNGTKWYWCKDGTQGAACTLETRTFHPGLFYVLTPGADPTLIASYQQYDLDDSKTSIPPASADRVCTAFAGCCPTGVCTLQQEQQNFANWFAYYRSRTHLMKGGLSEALANEVGKVRVGFGTINTGTKTIDGVSGQVVQLGMRDLNASQLSTVVNQLQGINPAGGTPLRAATTSVGNYFRRDATTDFGSPYRNVPGTGSDGQVPLACRRSYMLMTTDGYYNDADGNVGDVDSQNGPAYGSNGTPSAGNPNGYSPNQFVTGHPYSDGQKNMLADYAMANYVNDLQPNLANTVAPIPGGDPAYWQHLSMFTVGLGVTGTLAYPGALPDLISGKASWGTDKIDDLWHAAVDTQGGYFSVKDAPSLVTALSTALGRAGAQTASDSGVALASATILPGTAEYLTSYSSGIWTGDIMAYPLDAQGHLTGKTPIWTASQNLPKPFSARNLYTVDGTDAVKFSAGNTSGNWRPLLGVADTTSQNNLINFIAGDQSNEGVGKPFRVRAGILGDFVDSPLLYVRNFVDLGYDTLSTSAPGYRDYINNVKNKRANGVLFEGANDGMLHAFNADTGAELFGYVPNAVLHNLSILTQPSYGSPGANFHTDFVDGPQIETDAFIQTKRGKQGGAAWSNIVAGSYGGGAPGFYALDITDLTTFDANTVLWEINASTPGYGADIGYVFSNIAVGVLPASGSVGSLANASWKAFVGNGVYSQNGHAALLVVDLATGNIDKELVLDNGTGNGLMGVQLVYDTNRQVVAAYAGDMKGNLWRIEFTGANAPVAGFNGQPLFSAGPTQPITVQPSVYANPAGGNMVLFGTGKLIDTADMSSTDPQSFYAIWDKTPSGSSAEGKPSPFGANPRSQLQQQVIAPDGAGLYNVNSTAPNYTTQLGWFMDLTPVSPKQRVIYPATLLSNYVLVNTMSPADTPKSQCDETLGMSAYFLLPILTGVQSTTSPVWDTNGDGLVDANDSVDAGYSVGFGGKTTVGWFPVPQGSPPGTQQECVNMNKNGNKGCQIPFNGPGPIKSRVWKQLMTPPF